MRTLHARLSSVFSRRLQVFLALQAGMVLAGCGGGGSSQAGPLTIAFSTLPNGSIGAPYSATLSATGGKTPYTWTLGGTLPTGLSLNVNGGSISGTPTSAINSAALALTVTDSSNPAQSASATLHLSVYASVTVSPQNGAVVTGQVLNVTSATNDPTGVDWSATGTSCSGGACGTFSSTSTLNGVATAWTPPLTPGVYALKAVSAGDGTTSASANVGVTDLAGIHTVHYDLARNGANVQEYALTPAIVSGGDFGKLFSCTVDGAIYTEPLWEPQLDTGGAKHNVVFVATQHDSLYAFDADSNTSPCKPLWQVSLTDTAHGGAAGEAPVPSVGASSLVGAGYGDIAPEVGVTGTPVIDPSTQTLYVVAKSVDSTGANFYQRLHAIDILSGSEKFAGPANIAGTFAGTGDGGATTTFVARQQNQRPGLALADGTIYIAWSSHEDDPPYYGWIMGYDAATLTQKYVLNISPNVQWGGIWMNGNAPPVDSDGYIYFLTGNAEFDANSPGPPNNDFGDSILKMDETLNITQSFTPSDQQMDDMDDADLGSGGGTLIDLPANGALPTHLIAGGGKDGYLYLLNRDNMGGYGDANAWQRMNWGAAIFGTVAYWNNALYMAGAWGSLQAFALDPQTAMIDTMPSSAASTYFGFPGSSPAVSSTPDNMNGIVWALENTNYCTPQSPNCGPAVLHAYQAGNLASELWNSNNKAIDAAGFPVKFTLPTVANGHVYIGTRGNNTGGAENSTSIPGELDVYGLK